jgi:hypothetical protein
MRDLAVVTVCDENYFEGLLMLHRSVQESHPCMVACYDLGLNPRQQAEAERRPNLQLLPLPDDPLIDRIKSTMSVLPPLAKANKRIWPLWICPVLIKHAPFRDVIWMDCDLVVLRNLSELFAAVDTGPVFTPENKAPQLTPNRPALYRLLPIDRQFDPLVPVINAGVSGHDQGALIWAIQSCGLEHRVVGTTDWNLCVDHTSLAHRTVAWDDGFLGAVRAEVPQANILHWNGREPPWFHRQV